jgi:hypothetical protein
MLQKTGNYVSKLTMCVSTLRTLKNIARPKGLILLQYKKLTRLLKDVNSFYREWKNLG